MFNIITFSIAVAQSRAGSEEGGCRASNACMLARMEDPVAGACCLSGLLGWAPPIHRSLCACIYGCVDDDDDDDDVCVVCSYWNTHPWQRAKRDMTELAIGRGSAKPLKAQIKALDLDDSLEEDDDEEGEEGEEGEDEEGGGGLGRLGAAQQGKWGIEAQYVIMMSRVGSRGIGSRHCVGRLYVWPMCCVPSQ